MWVWVIIAPYPTEAQTRHFNSHFFKSNLFTFRFLKLWLSKPFHFSITQTLTFRFLKLCLSQPFHFSITQTLTFPTFPLFDFSNVDFSTSYSLRYLYAPYMLRWSIAKIPECPPRLATIAITTLFNEWRKTHLIIKIGQMLLDFNCCWIELIISMNKLIAFCLSSDNRMHERHTVQCTVIV